MLIRSEKYGVQGWSGRGRPSRRFRLRPLPTLLLGGLLLLIGP